MNSIRSEPLDAIRGLAIVLVISRHYFDLSYGQLGVDLFFVLSGFLIGGILLDGREQIGYFSSFYGRRAFRILPLYWLLLAIAPPAHVIYYLVFAQQIPWLEFGYPTNEPTFVTWSLAIEEQFYLILPAMIYWLPRRWLIRCLWLGVLLAPALRWLFHAYLPGNSWQFLLPGRCDELFGGVLLACLSRGFCRSPIVWALLACFPPLFDLVYSVLDKPFCFLSIAAFVCCIIVWLAFNMERPVILRPLVWPGRRCYALYLFHIVIGRCVVDLGLPLLPLTTLGATCIFAELSWRFVERPLICFAKARFPTIAPAVKAMSAEYAIRAANAVRTA